MSEGGNDQIYEIEVTYQDSGISLEFAMDQWRDRIKEDFSSFEAIKNFYKTDIEELTESMSEHAEEIGPEESREGSGIVISNPPKEWKEDMGRAAPFLRLAEKQLVRMGLFSLVEDEMDAQKSLLEAGQFKPLIIRQSAFFEGYLELQSQLAFQHQKGEGLSNNEMNIIEGMGHRDRIRLAHLLGVIGEEEHGHLQSMAKLRNNLAHNPWMEFGSDEEGNIEATAKKILGILESKIEQAYEKIEQDNLGPADDDFDIGFEGLDPDTQLLQLSILDVIESQGGEGSLMRIESVLTWDPEEVRQRCHRMDHIGYLDLDKESKIVSIRDKGTELLEEEYPGD